MKIHILISFLYIGVIGSAHSDFEVLFEVMVPTPISLIGSLGTGMYDSNSSLQLDWNGASYLSFSSVYNQEIVVSEHGILEPGAYTLTVNALTNVYASGFGAAPWPDDRSSVWRVKRAVG